MKFAFLAQELRFFWKKNLTFIIIADGGKIAVETLSNDIPLECLFHLNWTIFLQKGEKFQNLMRKEFEKTRFHHFKRHF